MTSTMKKLFQFLDVVEFDNICRVCLQAGKNSLLECRDWKKFQKLTQIDVDSSDLLPKHICDKCLQRLEVATSFIDEFKTSDKILNEIVRMKSARTYKYVVLDHAYCKSSTSKQSETVDGKDEASESTSASDKTEEKGQKHWRCQFCNLTFLTRGLLNIHRRTHRLCGPCSLTFPTFATFWKHNRLVHQKFKCRKCDSTFNNETDFRTHKVTHHPNVNKESAKICQFCGRNFKSTSSLNRHLRTHDKELTANKPTTSVLCHMCGKNVLKTSYSKHINAHMGLHSTRINCHICHKQVLKVRFNTHLKTHTGIKPYKCDICLKCYSTRSSFKLHMFLHTGEKPFSCTCCGKKFSFKRYLNMHMKMHRLEHTQTYTCSVCEKVFTNKQTCERHVKRHDETITANMKRVRSYEHQCFYCKSNLATRKDLIQHVAMIHADEVSVESISKPYVCEVCFREFDSKGHLQAHFLTHTGQREHKCGYCGKEFALKGNLMSHVRLHEGIFRFSCEYCGKGFYYRTKFNKHLSSCSKKCQEV